MNSDSHERHERSMTRLLDAMRSGDAHATESLLDMAYAELGSLARAHLAAERGGHTLQPTALVHEAWLKLRSHMDRVEDRPQFFAVASQAMRRVLTDYARTRNRQKRGGGRPRVELDQGLSSELGVQSAEPDLVDLEDSLARLSELNPRHARVVELRIFGGLTIAETATALSVSHATIESDWFTARAWLRKELRRTS